MSDAVHIIADSSRKLDPLRLMLEKKFSVTATLLDRALQNARLDTVVVAADLRVTDNIAALKQRFGKTKAPCKRIFILEQTARLFVVQAYALGATKVLFSPVRENELYGALIGAEPEALPDNGPWEGTRGAASAGAEAMQSMFSAVLAGRPIDTVAAMIAAGKMADNVAEDGLTSWLDTVRQHHEGTYQHCLLVTGVAVDFALHLGLAKADVQRLYSAAMFHDIGKAAIPAKLLNKPGKLDRDERLLIETHPVAGYDYLKQTAGISPEVLDCVRHHHEYLDGSGYPDGLGASEIPDIVRILTISDIFAALIEARSYKPPMSREKAYDIILDMHGKLEVPLVKAFAEVAMNR
ncbi:HD domain-containing phosphohydrolase [Tardiphaga sp.]|uniref:HD-GYP domain-containing protein n=1 Tax=Tardiphaga sp. TaxID=1926292 RepID=UPI0025DDC306|nr:HD domain-containing phosphohydrolase [Tardiphaga sp.]